MNQGPESIPYLSICAIYRDEGPYLREWIEFHRLVGVERFFLYDNLSVDDHREVLAPYVADGTVVLHHWPISFRAQIPCYKNCLDRHRDDSRWITFIDIDEFLFSPTGERVSEVLRDYEEWPGVGVYGAVFGTSGHQRRPDGLVIENYLLRTDPSVKGDKWFRRAKHIKSIVDPKRTRHPIGAHRFLHTLGKAVDENRQPLPHRFPAIAETLSYSRLRINHYFTKSEEEFLARRLNQVRVADGVSAQFSPPDRLEYLEELNEERDEAITAYVPALRQALGMDPVAGRSR